jgi:hypothetical protein
VLVFGIDCTKILIGDILCYASAAHDTSVRFMPIKIDWLRAPRILLESVEWMPLSVLIFRRTCAEHGQSRYEDEPHHI